VWKKKIQKLIEKTKKTFVKKKSTKENAIKKVAVDWEIDLHGCTVEEAKGEVQDAISLMQAHNMKSLRLIHGGFEGSYGPLKNQLDRYFRTKLHGVIGSWGLEPGNSGATLINLRKN
jgi:DNA-nicking Smr family endonuclease